MKANDAYEYYLESVRTSIQHLRLYILTDQIDTLQQLKPEYGSEGRFTGLLVPWCCGAFFLLLPEGDGEPRKEV